MDDYFTEITDLVADHIDDAHIVAFDGCHKIYLALDAEQADWFRSNSEITHEGTPESMLGTVGAWWDESCPLRFVSAVRTNHADPNAGYFDIVPQGWDDDEDDDEDDEDDEYDEYLVG